jgi:hypothetical protein
LHAIAGIHCDLSRETAGLLAQHTSAYGIIIGIVLPEGELRLCLRVLRHDLLMLRKFWFATDAAIRGIVDLRLAGGADLPASSGSGNRQ